MNGELKLYERYEQWFQGCSKIQKYLIRYGIFFAVVGSYNVFSFFSSLYDLMYRPKLNFFISLFLTIYAMKETYFFIHKVDVRINEDEDWKMYRRGQLLGMVIGIIIVLLILVVVVLAYLQ